MPGKSPRYKARKLNVYRKGCKGKIRHKTKEAAFLEALALAKKTGEMFTEYHCTFCERWHTGHVNDNPRSTKSAPERGARLA